MSAAQSLTKTVISVVGARPNFVKMAPVVSGLARCNLRNLVVHTGQHYDRRMSAEVLHDLEFPEPDFLLGVGSGTHAEQTARVLLSFERVLLETKPVLVIVAGDVNSTLACAIAAAKLGVSIAHVEAGLRSRDWSMPEEINRVLTDRLSTLLFTHSPEAAPNLVAEGIDPSTIHPVGNSMIDTLYRHEAAARTLRAWQDHGVQDGRYALVTLHRPSNVDVDGRLVGICAALCRASRRFEILFPIHPRTRFRLEALGLFNDLVAAGVHCLEPVGYSEFLSLELGAGAVLTDSGGVQEETTALGVRCFTLRANTERPVTIELGTNTLLGDDPSAIDLVQLAPRRPVNVPLWDGRSGDRIAAIVAAWLSQA
jgi:UDP-N-acetylglucosamine 2-epimerase (non-hydrolysing)